MSDDRIQRENELNYEFPNAINDTVPIEKLLDPTRGMAKVYSNNKGGEVYACVYREAFGKMSQLAMKIKYPDGSYSDTIIVKQSELFEIPIPKVIKDIKNRKTPSGEELESAEALRLLKRSKILKKLSDYATKDMRINYVRIFYILQKHYSLLPIKEFEHKQPIDDVYHSIVKMAFDKVSKDPADELTIQDDCYNLTYEDMEEIAILNGYALKELCRELMFYDLLKVDKDRKRFQYSITYKNKTNRYYSIKNERSLRQALDEKTVEVEIPYESSPKCYSALFQEIDD